MNDIVGHGFAVLFDHVDIEGEGLAMRWNLYFLLQVGRLVVVCGEQAAIFQEKGSLEIAQNIYSWHPLRLTTILDGAISSLFLPGSESFCSNKTRFCSPLLNLVA